MERKRRGRGGGMRCAEGEGEEGEGEEEEGGGGGRRGARASRRVKKEQPSRQEAGVGGVCRYARVQSGWRGR